MLADGAWNPGQKRTPLRDTGAGWMGVHITPRSILPGSDVPHYYVNLKRRAAIRDGGPKLANVSPGAIWKVQSA